MAADNAVQLSGLVTMEGRAIMALVSRLLHEEAGQDLIEYALLAAFISVAAIAAITTVGTALNSSYQTIHTQVAATP